MQTQEFRLKLYPKNFDTERDFYASILEFPIVKEWNRSPDDRGTMFQVGSTTLEILSPEDVHQTFAGFGLSLEVSNVRELWKVFQSNVIVTLGLRHNEWGDTSFEITDPEGLKITLFTKD